jgi:hypothetical protein
VNSPRLLLSFQSKEACWGWWDGCFVGMCFMLSVVVCRGGKLYDEKTELSSKIELDCDITALKLSCGSALFTVPDVSFARRF